MMESAAVAAAAAATQAHIVSLLCVFILRVPTPSCFPLSLSLSLFACSHTQLENITDMSKKVDARLRYPASSGPYEEFTQPRFRLL